MRVCAVLPVYNEADTVEEIVSRVRATGRVSEIVAVDDASSDGTRQTLERLAGEIDELRVFFHETNRGKGAALRTAFAHVESELIVIQDADLEYDPADYAVLLGPLLDGRADVVFGSRFLGGPHRVMFFWHYVANVALTLLSNALNNVNLTDMETGYKAFRREVLDGLVLRSDRFGFEPEFTAKLAKRRYRMYEVPISYSGRTYEEGKKIGWRDALKALFAIVWFRLFE
jgi:glycosyltransferase involved in cell wall biosynthesis